MRGKGIYGSFRGIQKQVEGSSKRENVNVEDMPSSVRDSDTFMSLIEKVNDATDKGRRGQGPEQGMVDHVEEADVLTYIMSSDNPEAALKEYEQSIGNRDEEGRQVIRASFNQGGKMKVRKANKGMKYNLGGMLGGLGKAMAPNPNSTAKSAVMGFLNPAGAIADKMGLGDTGIGKALNPLKALKAAKGMKFGSGGQMTNSELGRLLSKYKVK